MVSLIASVAMVSCSDDKGNPNAEGAHTGSARSVADGTPSKVSESLAPVVQRFDGQKYAATELSHDTDYFIVYFTASW